MPDRKRTGPPAAAASFRRLDSQTWKPLKIDCTWKYDSRTDGSPPSARARQVQRPARAGEVPLDPL